MIDRVESAMQEESMEEEPVEIPDTPIQFQYVKIPSDPAKPMQELTMRSTR